MKILMVSWEYPPQVVGGLARHVQELSEALTSQGHQVHVLTGPFGNEPADSRVGGVHVHRARLGYPEPRGFYQSVLNLNFAFLERAIPLLREENFDLVHCHDWLGAYAAKVLKHACGLPLITTIHATEYGRNSGLYTDLQRQISDAEWWLTYESWRVICCSKYMSGELSMVFHLPQDKLEVISNGVDPSRFALLPEDDPVAYRRRYARDQEKILFFIGRLVREKGAQVLLEALPKIRRYWPDVKCIIAGDGPMLAELRAKAHELQVADIVSFTGFVNDQERNRLYAISDVAVFPSFYEPFGIVALEAMATGTPVVASDTGGLSEIIVHGVNGLKAYPGNANSLADNVLTLLYRPDLARDLAGEASRDVTDLYSWAEIARKTTRVYRQVIQAAQRSGYSLRTWRDQALPSRYEYTASYLTHP